MRLSGIAFVAFLMGTSTLALAGGGVNSATPHTRHAEGVDAPGYDIAVDGSKTYRAEIQKNDGEGKNVCYVFRAKGDHLTRLAQVESGDALPEFQLKDGDHFFVCVLHVYQDGHVGALAAASASMEPGSGHDFVNLLFKDSRGHAAHVHFDRK